MEATGLNRATAITLLLLKHGADPNIQDKNCLSALYWAARNGRHGTILVLLENGANPNLQAGDGGSPLIESMKSYHDAASSLLLIKYGADPNLQNAAGNFALYFAVVHGRIDLVLMLLENGADPNLQNIQGHTALMDAALRGHEDAISLLLKYDAWSDIKDDKGLTAEAWAGDNQDVLRLLSIAKGSSLELQESDRAKSLPVSTKAPSQRHRESHRSQRYGEQNRDPKNGGAVLKVWREQRKETTRTMGEAWKRFMKRPWKGKGKMEIDDDFDYSLSDGDSDSTHHA